MRNSPERVIMNSEEIPQLVHFSVLIYGDYPGPKGLHFFWNEILVIAPFSLNFESKEKEKFLGVDSYSLSDQNNQPI